MGGLASGIRGPGAGLNRDQKEAILKRLQSIEDELQSIIRQYHESIPERPIIQTAEISTAKRIIKTISSLFSVATTLPSPSPASIIKPNLPELLSRIHLLREEYEFLKSQCDSEMQRTLEIPELAKIREGIFAQIGQILFEANNGKPDLAPDQAAITSFYSHLDGLTLTHDEKQKLKEMMTDANYQKAVEAAQELHKDCKVPTKEYIIAELKKLSVSQLKNICEMQKKPTLLIVPPASFADKVKAMNEHKHYPNQGNTFVYKYENSPYKNAPTMTTGRISIVDGTIHPKPPKSGVSTELKFRRDHYDSLFMSKNLGHIDKDEYAVLMQISLIEAEKTGNNSLIIDNWKAGSGTASFIDPTTLINASLVACAIFDSDFRQVYFYAGCPDDDYVTLRGRSSFQVCTFPA